MHLPHVVAGVHEMKFSPLTQVERPEHGMVQNFAAVAESALAF